MKRKCSCLYQKLIVTGGLVTSLLAHGCASAPHLPLVSAGDKTVIQFTCKTQNGELAATTEPGIASDPEIPKSPVFQARNTDTPLALIAGTDPTLTKLSANLGFEGKILERLAEEIVGMKTGRTRTVTVEADPSPQTAGNQTVQMTRIRQRPKKVKMSVTEFRQRKNVEPKIGLPYTVDPAFPGEVVSVTESEVIIDFHGEPGAKVITPFGEGTVRDSEHHYEIVMDVYAGKIVRSGGMVGRITDVTEQMFTIDYSHPFGGETLNCDVTVESIERNQEK